MKIWASVVALTAITSGCFARSSSHQAILSSQNVGEAQPNDDIFLEEAASMLQLARKSRAKGHLDTAEELQLDLSELEKLHAQLDAADLQ